MAANEVKSRRNWVPWVVGAAVLIAAAVLWRVAGHRPDARPEEAAPERSPAIFAQRNGEALYRAICQGCHMADGRGAGGAGTYPSLAANPKLEDGGYPAFMVIKGNKGMPGFAEYLDDEQVAAVVNYVRRGFGNGYTKPYTAAEVTAVRQASGT